MLVLVLLTVIIPAQSRPCGNSTESDMIRFADRLTAAEDENVFRSDVLLNKAKARMKKTARSRPGLSLSFIEGSL